MFGCSLVQGNKHVGINNTFSYTEIINISVNYCFWTHKTYTHSLTLFTRPGKVEFKNKETKDPKAHLPQTNHKAMSVLTKKMF